MQPTCSTSNPTSAAPSAPVMPSSERELGGFIIIFSRFLSCPTSQPHWERGRDCPDVVLSRLSSNAVASQCGLPVRLERGLKELVFLLNAKKHWRRGAVDSRVGKTAVKWSSRKLASLFPGEYPSSMGGVGGILAKLEKCLCHIHISGSEDSI